MGLVGDSATVGTVTFSLAQGGNSLAIGTGGIPGIPDWYPPMAGNEIAMGYENLQVQTAAPVFSLGFDFVEPNATMPAYGGTPVDSTFEIVLYHGEHRSGPIVLQRAGRSGHVLRRLEPHGLQPGHHHRHDRQ